MNERRVSNADLFWADKRWLHCAEATGFLFFFFFFRAATFGINYQTRPGTAAAYRVHQLLHARQYKL